MQIQIIGGRNLVILTAAVRGLGILPQVTSKLSARLQPSFCRFPKKLVAVCFQEVEYVKAPNKQTAAFLIDFARFKAMTAPCQVKDTSSGSLGVLDPQRQ